jgi:hypothetical protein
MKRCTQVNKQARMRTNTHARFIYASAVFLSGVKSDLFLLGILWSKEVISCPITMHIEEKNIFIKVLKVVAPLRSNMTGEH